MKITKFESDFTSSKVPVSPYGDLTFDFMEEDTTPAEFLETLRKSFILNRNYHFKKEIRARRTKWDLGSYLSEELEYVILDLDKVKTLYDENQIIDFFKEKDYFVGLIPSRSYNGKTNFNLKGFILAKGMNNRASIKAILEDINKGIYPYTRLDMTALNEGSYQAPTYTEGIKLYQEGSYIPEFRLKDAPRQHISIEIDESHNKVVDICLDEYRLRGFQLVEFIQDEDLMIFAHPSEKTPKGYFVYIDNPFNMNHFNTDKSFNIFDAVKTNKYTQEYFDKVNKEKRIQEFSGVGAHNKMVTVNERYLTINNDTKNLVNEWYSTNGLLKIKSAMGTGKSNIIDYCIGEAKVRKLKILLVTNRISVAKDFHKKYDIKLYSNGNYQHGDDLIVQYDSLWKYSLKHFDLVILDEMASLTLHTRNTLGDYGNLNKTKLMYAMKSKPCLIADAFLFGFEDSFVEYGNSYMINNEYREDINIYEYDNISSIIGQIVNISVQDQGKHKVSISCTGKATAEAVAEVCKDNGLNVMLLSSDTLEEEKDSLYEIFEMADHDFWDVLIYTPTLTVGVSILNDTINHFHIDENNSADVVSSLQMIRRSRKAKNIHFMVSERRRFMETRLEVLDKEIRNNIEKYYNKSSSLLIAVDDHGDFSLSKTGEFINKVEILHNKLENNHKHSFELLLRHQIKDEIKMVENVPSTVNINKIKSDMKEKKVISMNEVLDNLKPVEYEDSIIEEYKQRNYMVSPKDKMLKIMADVKTSLRIDTSPDIVKEITKLEVNKKFKFVAELKRLKLYLTKNEDGIKQLLSFIVSENTVNKSQIQYFKYLMALKKHGITLRSKVTTNQINKVNDLIGYGDFRAFLKKIGYKKRGNTFTLDETYIKYSKFIK